MANRWFVARRGKEIGPYTSDQLKRMAASGQLYPAEMIRREDQQAPRRAGSVKGLFAEAEATVARPTFGSKLKSTTPDAESVVEHPTPRSTGLPPKRLLIGLSGVAGATLLLCCGVLGVFIAKDRQPGQKEGVKGDGVPAVGETPTNDRPADKEKTPDAPLTVNKGSSSGSISVEISRGGRRNRRPRPDAIRRPP